MIKIEKKEKNVESPEYDLAYRIYYHNVQSIRGMEKSLKFLEESNDYDYDIICITETHLSNEIQSKNFIDMNAYRVFRSERDAMTKGGVLIACKREIEIIDCKMNNIHEEIWLTIKDKDQLIHLCCVYISKPRGFGSYMELYLDHLEEIFKNIRDEKIFIAGDLNFSKAFKNEPKNAKKSKKSTKSKKPEKKSNAQKFNELLCRYSLTQECNELNDNGNLIDSIITNIENLSIKKATKLLSRKHPDHIPIVIHSTSVNSLPERKQEQVTDIELKIFQIQFQSIPNLTKWECKFNERFPFAFLFFTNISWPSDDKNGTPREITINKQTYKELWYSKNNLLLMNKKFNLTHDLSFNDEKTKNFNAFYITLSINKKYIKLCFLIHRITEAGYLEDHLKDLKTFYNNDGNIIERIDIIIGDYKTRIKRNHNKYILPIIEELKLFEMTNKQCKSNVFSNKKINVTYNNLYNIIDTGEIISKELIRKIN